MRRLCIIVTIVIFLPVTILGEYSDIANRPCCREAKSVKFPGTDPQPVSRGACVFHNTLCSYVQGCADTSMNNWTRNDGYAYAHPKFADSYDDQTVLVSPLLDLRQSCYFTINYGLVKNGDMDVFLEDSLGEHVKLIPWEIQWFDQLKVFNKTVSIVSSYEKRYGRVKIRATGRGHNGSQVRLNYVSLHEGDCKGCTFEGGFCDWVAISWNITSTHTDADNSERGSIARLARSFGTLSSPMISPTPTLTCCVRFRYMVWGTESSLKVSVVDPDGKSTEMWRVTSSKESRVWRTGVFPVQFSGEYRIRFAGQQEVPITSSVVALGSVLVNPDTPHTQCRFKPPEASPGGSQSFTIVPTASPTSVKSSSTHTSLTSEVTSAQAESSTHDGAKTTKEDDSTTSLPVIIGASVAGGIVLITVIILLVFLMQRKRQIQGKSNEQNDARQPFILPKEESQSYLSMANVGGDYTEIGDLHFRPSRSTTNDYTEIDDSYIASQRNSTRPKPDDSPYELAKAFPDKSHLLATPTNAGLAPTADQTEDDYNHIPGSRTTPQTTQNASRDDYHTLNFEGRELSEEDSKHGGPPKLYDHMQSGPDEVYNKTRIGKRTVVIDSDYDHVKN